MTEREVVVVGAGPSGIASALALKDAGLRPLVIDRATAVGSSWRGRYDRLRLNTLRINSHLPGRRFPRGTALFPSRDDVVAHLEHHASEDGIDLELGTEVERLERDGDAWLLTMSAGPIRAPQVIVATGYENRPWIPDWSGRDAFAGELLHAHDYRNPEPFRDRSVLVVGPGCSGMEIAYDLADGGAAKVWLSARTPPNIVLRVGSIGIPADVLGIIGMRIPSRLGDAVARFGRRIDIGDLTDYGLPVPEEGPMARVKRLGVAPAIVDREVIEAIKAGRIEIVRGVVALDAGGVRLADEARVEPDAVICATGYRRALEPLVGHLGVLDERGLPRAHGREPAAPGLRFVGYVSRPGGLGYMAKQARSAAKAIRRELRRPGAPPPRREAAATA